MLTTSDATYVMLAEAGILHVAAFGLLQLKSSTGTFPVMYTWYVVGTSGVLFLLVVVLVCVRLRRQHPVLFQVMLAAVDFHVALTLTFVSYLATVVDQSKCSQPIEALLLRARLQESESTWFVYMAVVLGITLAIVQALLVWFIGSAARSDLAPAPTAPMQAYRLMWTAVLLGQITQLTLHVHTRKLCESTIECTAENIDPQKYTGVLDTTHKYTTALVKLAVLLAVDLLELGMGVLVQASKVCLDLTPYRKGMPVLPPAVAARLQHSLVLLGCVWPVAVLWWFLYVMHDSECERVFHTYNVVVAVLFSTCAAWLGLSTIYPTPEQPVQEQSLWKTQTTHFLQRDTACCIGTQQTHGPSNTQFRRKIKLKTI